MRESTPITPAFPGATLMILGAARCGTSSIHEFLRQHPAVCASEPKEPPFFEAEYERGLDYYRRTYFPNWAGQRVVVDGRVSHLALPYVAPRIRDSFPNARFIVSLREPAERAFSHWAIRYANGLEKRSFEVAIVEARQRLHRGNQLEGPDAERIWRAVITRSRPRITRDLYLEAGFYAAHLKRFFGLFPRDRFLIVSMDELRSDTTGAARRLLDFAGLDPTLAPDRLPTANGHAAVGPRLLHRLDVVLGMPSRLLSLSVRRRLRAWSAPFQRRLTRPAHVMASLRELYAPHDRALCELMGWAKCPWEGGAS